MCLLSSLPVLLSSTDNLTTGGMPNTDPMLGVGGGLQLEQGLKSKQTIDLISEKAVRIDSSCPLDSLFASDEEDEGQDVRIIVAFTHTLHMYM